MAIDKLVEFAKDGERSTSGLTLLAGFPRAEKPARVWFNSLFNQITSKINEIITEVNKEKPVSEFYAVDDIYMTTKTYADGAAVRAAKGYGTWVKFAEGRTLVGHSSKAADPSDYKTMGKTFGENEHVLTLEESASHKHPVTVFHEFDSEQYPDPTGWFAVNSVAQTSNLKTHSDSEPDNSRMLGDGTGNSLGSVGGGEAHNNIQPSIVVGYWLRTA